MVSAAWVRTIVLTTLCAAALGLARAAEPDADGDGFSDAIEKALQTDPNNASSTPYGGQPAGAAQPINKPGARINLDFKNNQPDDLTVFGNVDVPDIPADVDGRTVIIDLGGFVRVLTLDENGHAQTAQAILDVRKNTNGLHFIMTAQTGKLQAKYESAGLTNADASLKPVSLYLTLFIGKKKYNVTMDGLYNAKAGKAGTAFMGQISEDAKLKKPRSKITTVKVSPSP